MDSQEARHQIRLLVSHSHELWELVVLLPDPIERAVLIQHLFGVAEKISFLQKLCVD